MTKYKVPVMYITKAFALVDADSATEALQIIEDEEWDDLYGEETVWSTTVGPAEKYKP